MRKINIIKKEIRELKHKRFLYGIKKTNIRNKMIGQLAFTTAAVITPAILIGGMGKLSGKTPFYRDDKIVTEHTKIVYSSDKETEYTTQYGSYQMEKDDEIVDGVLLVEPATYTLYGSWKQNGHHYERTVVKYNISGQPYSFEQLNAMNEKGNLAKYVGGPTVKTEKRANITCEEYLRGAYVEAVVYDENKGNNITEKQSHKENAGETVGSLITYSCVTPFNAWLFAESSLGDKVFKGMEITDKKFIEYTEEIRELRKKEKLEKTKKLALKKGN